MGRTLRTKRLYTNEDEDFEGHGSAILLLIREGVAHDWKSLCRALKFNPKEFHSGHLELEHTLQNLIEAGLLESQNTHLGRYKVTDLAHQVVHRLGLSLTQAANMPYFSGFATRPFFGKPKRLEKAPHVFVLMPFDKKIRPVYDGPIKHACRSLRLSVERADDIFSASEIIADIWNAIVNCGALIADCTERNPNVFYELGLAHTIGKPVILISQRNEDVPFDVHYIRFIAYVASPTGLRKLESTLRKTLREVGKTIWAT
jgi:hypothetical protein